MEWVIYYADGTKFTSGDGFPEDSPKWGLVAIAQKVDGSVMPLVGDYFTFRGRWYNHDLTGIVDQMTHFAKDIQAFRVGRYVDEQIYKSILTEIHTWAHSHS